MVIKSKQIITVLDEGTHPAKPSSVKGKPTENEAKRVLMGFKIDGYEREVFKDTLSSFEPGGRVTPTVSLVLPPSTPGDGVNK
jgi:hypothetical protein